MVPASASHPRKLASWTVVSSSGGRYILEDSTSESATVLRRLMVWRVSLDFFKCSRSCRLEKSRSILWT